MDLPDRLTQLERGERITVSMQQRRVNFGDIEAPEVEIMGVSFQRGCPDARALLHLLGALPRQRLDNFSWWALDRVEACCNCGRRFDTRRFHWALAVTIEVPGEALIACWYPERFCNHCHSPDHPPAVLPATH